MKKAVIKCECSEGCEHALILEFGDDKVAVNSMDDIVYLGVNGVKELIHILVEWLGEVK